MAHAIFDSGSSMRLCPHFCAHLFLTDYCSSVKLHRFVKFARVSNPDKFSFPSYAPSEPHGEEEEGFF